MSEELVIRCCAPTLASLKTGNLFACPFATRDELYDSVRKLNCRLCRKGLRVLPMRYRNGVGLIYVYRPVKLQCDLCDTRARELLSARGYMCENPNRCVTRLMERLAAEQDGFPHEIGLFLGYPPEDVDGFIHRRCKPKCVGTWTVYGDAEVAQRRFALYRKCTNAYLAQHAKGRKLEHLTVSA